MSALASVERELRAAVAAEQLPEALLPAGVGVRDELDPPAFAVDLLETLREELEHLRARLFRPGLGHGDRDTPERAQRNALFSFSKKLASVL